MLVMEVLQTLDLPREEMRVRAVALVMVVALTLVGLNLPCESR